MGWSIAAVLAGAAIVSVLYHFVRTGVPPVPATRADVAGVVALLEGAQLPPGAHIYELGSGFGGLAIALGRAFPSARVTGVEISPLPWALSALRARGVRNVHFVRGDFRSYAFADASAVTTYLMIAPMPAVAALLDRTLRPDTPVVTAGFWFRDRKPERTIGQHVALYRWPAREARRGRG